ncbi:hypothetical protein C1645_803884 [Glomus cerebriforme]|uniref:Uncharacterized protein n=1 Tax=Glomus cerebriforme TaxID=658196 RepID=A0A397T691_9GLOM|nr:hypothetical protein C1645_803884 [Glomus cerebriforme]
MVTDQKHSSDSIASEQEVIRRTEKMARLFGLDKQNAEAYKALSRQIWGFEKQLENYHFENIKLKRRVNSLEAKIEDLDECVDREAVIDLIHEIVPSLIGKKDKDFSYSSESSKDSDSVEIIEVREKKAVPHKQRRRARLKKVKRDQPVGGIQKNKAFRVKHLTALTNIPSKSTSPETSSSESNSSESGSSSETSSSESSSSSGSSSESSSSSETSSSESGSSDSDIDEIVKMIKYQRIRKQIRKCQRGILEEECISSIRKIFSD